MLPYLLTVVIAQTELAPTWGNFVQNLGVAGVVSAILGWQLSLRVKESREKDERLDETNRKLLELAERTLPVLGEATRLLSESARHHDNTGGGDEFRSVLRRLEAQIDDLGRDRRKGGEP